MLTAGTILKREREKKNISYEEITAATKIHRHYLEALENDRYDLFASSVYAKGFIQNYARFLGLDKDKVLALFRRSVKEYQPVSVKDSKRSIEDIKFIVTPSTVIFTSISLLILVTFTYLFYQFYNFQKPPDLEITSPQDNSTVSEGQIEVEGKTDEGMMVTINDESIKTNDDGSFKVTLTLSEGRNTIVIKSKHPDNIGKEAIATRSIEYKPKKQVAGEETLEEPTQTMNIKITISEESTWLEVNIDDKPKIASIVLSGTNFSYKAKEKIYVRTGKIPTTEVTIDGRKVTLYADKEGFGSIICTLKKKEVNCQQP